MNLNAEKLAQGVDIFVEFACSLEGFKVDTIRFNGLALSEGPNFLHYLN